MTVDRAVQGLTAMAVIVLVAIKLTPGRDTTFTLDAGTTGPSVVLMPDMEWHVVVPGTFAAEGERHGCFTEDLGSKRMHTCGEIQGTRE